MAASRTLAALALSAALPCLAAHAAGDAKPNILILGDSISIGYTPPLTRLLGDRAVVVHNPGNAAHARNGAEKIDAWVGTSKWDVIHFNHGLHDLKYIDDRGSNVMRQADGHRQVDLPEYAACLETMVLRMKQTGAKLVFATTTPFPEGTKPVRIPADCALYNEAALAVMKKHGVAINDLCAYAAPHLAEWQKPVNVHFLDEGSNQLALEVARQIWKALGRDPAELPSKVPPAPGAERPGRAAPAKK
ncbi:MAG: SGNH/GDSL hydrolase family protein [Lentisphaerae bacterium]|nr:SGNH/GDSL hydrolase family protein [Lentisphaerota bacterium]